MNPTPKAKFCSCTEQYVIESGLLSPERMAEVQAEIDRRIEPCFDSQGRMLKGAFIGECPEGRMLFPRVDSDHMREYMRRSVLSGVLTEAELELIDKHCLSARETKMDAERFAKARKVEEWDGGVFFGDQYFPSVDELGEHLRDQDGEWPEYVWAAKPKTVITDLDVSDAVECQLADRGWEDMGTEDLQGVSELQAAMDKFIAENANVISYWPDYSTAILLATPAAKAVGSLRRRADGAPEAASGL